MNLDNMMCCGSNGRIHIFDTSKITKTKYTYRQIKSNFRRNDHRIRRKKFTKYGKRQRNKENTMLHQISKKMISDNRQIILEDLK